MVLVSGSIKHFVVQQRGVGAQRKDLMCAVAAVVQEEPPREAQSTVQAAERQASWPITTTTERTATLPA